jgi:hypothetical protein
MKNRVTPVHRFFFSRQGTRASVTEAVLEKEDCKATEMWNIIHFRTADFTRRVSLVS